MAFRKLLSNVTMKRSVTRSYNNINNLNSRVSGVKPLIFRRNFAVGPKDGALKPVYNAIMKNNTTYIFTIVAVAAVAGVVSFVLVVKNLSAESASRMGRGRGKQV